MTRNYQFLRELQQRKWGKKSLLTFGKETIKLSLRYSNRTDLNKLPPEEDLDFLAVRSECFSTSKSLKMAGENLGGLVLSDVRIPE